MSRTTPSTSFCVLTQSTRNIYQHPSSCVPGVEPLCNPNPGQLLCRLSSAETGPTHRTLPKGFDWLMGSGGIFFTPAHFVPPSHAVVEVFSQVPVFLTQVLVVDLRRAYGGASIAECMPGFNPRVGPHGREQQSWTTLAPQVGCVGSEKRTSLLLFAGVNALDRARCGSVGKRCGGCQSSSLNFAAARSQNRRTLPASAPGPCDSAARNAGLRSGSTSRCTSRMLSLRFQYDPRSLSRCRASDSRSAMPVLSPDGLNGRMRSLSLRDTRSARI